MKAPTGIPGLSYQVPGGETARRHLLTTATAIVCYSMLRETFFTLIISGVLLAGIELQSKTMAQLAGGFTIQQKGGSNVSRFKEILTYDNLDRFR